ncbi:MAG: radical SAM protein [Candidatus Pacearchaeota archaeon]
MKLKHIYAIIPVGFLSKTSQRFHIGNLAAAILRALTPKEIKITITDENLGGKINFDSDADLILLLSVITAAAPKAYRIAYEFKKRGKTVGIGGPHPSVAPEEALEFCDFVGIGELEGYWHRILKDFENNKLKKIYKNKKPVALNNLSIDRSIIKDMKKKGHKINYLTTIVTYTTRGCPYNCAFCTVTNIYGAEYRFRPVTEVVEDLFKAAGKKLGFALFVDDNIWANPNYAKELFREIIKRKLKIKWISQASLMQAYDLELLKLAKKAGCCGLYIGYENVNPESLKEAHKQVNKPEQFIKLTKNIHRAKIPIFGSFVFGFDSDTKESIKKTVDFAIKANLDYAQFCILTPFKKTAIYEKLKKEKRIIVDGERGGKFHDNWSYYTFGNVVFKPKNMSPKELKEIQVWAFKKFFSLKSVIKRFMYSFFRYPLLFPFIAFFNFPTQSISKEQATLYPEKLLKKKIKEWEIENNINTIEKH